MEDGGRSGSSCWSLRGHPLSTLLGPALTTDFDFTNSPEAKQAEQILQERRSPRTRSPRRSSSPASRARSEDPAFVAAGQHVPDRPERARARRLPSAPGSVPADPRRQAADPQVAALGPIPSADGKAVLFTGIYTGDTRRRDHAFRGRRCRSANRPRGDGIDRPTCSGQVSSSEDFKVISEEDLRFGESIGIVAAIVVLLIVFGAIVAGYLPLLLTVFFALADHARHRRAVRHAVGLQLLHPEPDLDDGHRRRGGLRPVHRVAIPRGAAQRPREERRDPRVRRHGVTAPCSSAA